MNQKTLLFLAFSLTSFSMTAQLHRDSLAGEYYLQGVMETTSGFRLNPDSSFEFFFSQGALDRFGKGRWSVKQHTILLNSREKPSRDFALVSSSRQTGNNISIRMDDPNANIMKYVHVMIKGGNNIQDGDLDDSGSISFPLQPVDSMMLAFLFCPEKTSIFTALPKGHNYFEFRFEPWMMELFFHDFPLQMASGELKGPHPLLEGTVYTYQKSE